MFTVNIALMRRNKDRWNPIFGVVHAPVTKTTWFGGVIIPSERRGPEGTGLMMVNPSMPLTLFVWLLVALIGVKKTNCSLRS